MHALHIPLRAGWFPSRVYANLSNIITQRYSNEGALVPCETWDNAILNCSVTTHEQEFPMEIRTFRIAPGEANTWYIRILGTEFSAEFSTKHPKTLRFLPYTSGAEQAWHNLDLGYETLYPTITGSIFEFGFTDALLQMWAAFCDQLTNGRENTPFYCVTPEETRQQHSILTSALISKRGNQAIELDNFL
jgi:hypothetical protein